MVLQNHEETLDKVSRDFAQESFEDFSVTAPGTFFASAGLLVKERNEFTNVLAVSCWF